MKLVPLLVLLFGVTTCSKLLAQSSFDVFTYTEPKGFTKSTGKGYISYLKSDNKKGTYCSIALYSAGKSSNNVMDAFNSEWNELVATALSETSKPATEKAAAINGWQTITGTATFSFNGGTSAAMLFCFVNNGMAADVLVFTNGTDYESDYVALLSSLKIAAPTNGASINSGAEDKITNNSGAKPTSIIGEWSDNDLIIANYVNSSGGYVSDASSASNTSYKFNSNGTYESFFAFTQAYKTKTFYDKGKYSVNGNTITITPLSQVYKLNTKVQPTDPKALKTIKLNYKFDYNEDRKKWHLQLEGIGDDYTGRNVLYSVSSASKSNTTTSSPPTISANSNSKFGGDITGVWLCYANNYPFSVDMIWKRRVFFNDGTFLEGHPHSGLLNFKEDDNHELGTYQISGNNGSIKKKAWNSPTAIQLIKPNQLKIGNDVYYKSADVNGKTFSGSYTSYAPDFFGEVSSQPENNRSLIHFYSNGTFVDEGIFSIFLKSYNGTDDSPGKGTYSIKDYTIVFKYNDGRTRTATISTANSSNLQDCKFLSLSNGILNKYK